MIVFVTSAGRRIKNRAVIVGKIITSVNVDGISSVSPMDNVVRWINVIVMVKVIRVMTRCSIKNRNVRVDMTIMIAMVCDEVGSKWNW